MCWHLLEMWGWSVLKECMATTCYPRQRRALSSLQKPDSWDKGEWKLKDSCGKRGLENRDVSDKSDLRQQRHC